jgi:hypothetical protein
MTYVMHTLFMFCNLPIILHQVELWLRLQTINTPIILTNNTICPLILNGLSFT